MSLVTDALVSLRATMFPCSIVPRMALAMAPLAC